ncbi:hypothetical protein Mal52_20850 [Symmachiella dynata]|uniref:Uncharacterized protein n=1 Tax=Symmachiella dynata TaxID=2527995 RepID=A0A517ZM82_9PLAN|nr:hypothetical protein [Symmachiella dynata]QDU43609.1 hypothetical protein Mal52_20850 [Symmachiella dynata]
MKFPYLIASLLVLTCGCSPKAPPTWKPVLDSGHHLGFGAVSVFAFGYTDVPEHSIVFFFPFDVNSSTEHTSNPATRTFDYSGKITLSPSKEKVMTYHIASSDVSRITCNDSDYELKNGSVFHVSKDGTIKQLPFAGLQPTREYVLDLKDYFDSHQGNATEPKE